MLVQRVSSDPLDRIVAMAIGNGVVTKVAKLEGAHNHNV